MEETILQLVHVTGKKQRNGFQITDVTMQLREGYIYAIAGENGAGKTTLLNLIGREDSRYTGNMILMEWILRQSMQKQWKVSGSFQRTACFLRTETEKKMLLFLVISMKIMKKNGSFPIANDFRCRFVHLI